MLFNSLEYIIFLPAVVLLYFLIPHRFRWVFLLMASYYFYMCWKAEYIILIVASTLVDYFCGIQMSKLATKKARKKYLIISLISNLGILFFFKYFDFFNQSTTALLQQFNIFYNSPHFNVLLPVGISFYTFQTLSYSIEVYNGKQKAEKHLGIFALYVSFFPQLVAGPIERFSRLGPQFRLKHLFSYENLSNGLRLILYGLFIKMVVADNLSVYVDQVYNNPISHNSLSVMTAVFFYSFQIYADFYGYSLIAIGSALLLGIKIMDNFKTPYLAKSISEFWQRWHISLSSWFRDYLYYPLGGNKVKIGRWIFNILLVFTVSGLWHGADWSFVIWGAVFGLIYLIEKQFNRHYQPAPSQKFTLKNLLLALKTFLLVTIIWIFFRSEDMSKVGDVFRSLVFNFDQADAFVVDIKIWIFLVIFIVSDILFYNSRFDKWCDNKPLYLRWLVYSVLIYSTLVFAGVEDYAFIYFQF